MTAYPADFRCAQITPYSLAVDMGLLRTTQPGSNARQRRLYKTMPTTFALEFVMTVQELGRWQQWVNDHAYDFFVIDNLESYQSGKLGRIASPHNIRFISSLAIDNPVYGWVRVKVQAEGGAADDLPDLAWIIAGTPALPSAGLPPVAFNFMVPGTMPAGATIARGSTGWYWNAAGALASVGNNLPRWTYDPTSLALLGLLNEPAATNSIRNAAAIGSTPGVMGAGGAMPINWFISANYAAVGATATIGPSGTDQGVPYLETRIAGTALSSAFIDLAMLEATTGVPIANGQQFLFTGALKLVAGSFGGTLSAGIRGGAYLHGTAGGYVGNAPGTVIYAPTPAAWMPFSYSLTPNVAGTLYARPYLTVQLNNGQAFDFTVRVGLGQMLIGTLPGADTSPIVSSNAAAAVTRAADVVFVPLTDGTYSVTVGRAAGTTNLANQTATGARWRVPVDRSPLQTVTATKTGPAVWIIAGTPAAPSPDLIDGGTPATWTL